MTSPARKVQVTCPACGTEYEEWFRPSINLGLDNFDEDYLRSATTATCPGCGTVLDLRALVVDADGTWEVPGDDDTPQEGEG